MKYIVSIVMAFCAIWLASAADAQTHSDAPMPVSYSTITFYSHSFGENFPHAFVIIEDFDSSGLRGHEAFGFSARHLSPGILLGTVKGHIIEPNERYIRQSDPHFTLPLSPEQRFQINDLRMIWDRPPGNRYNLNKHNCVHFISEVAMIMGLSVNMSSEYYKKPKFFLMEVADLNAALFQPPPPPDTHRHSAQKLSHSLETESGP